MSIVGRLLRFAAIRRMRSLRRAAADPMPVQRRVLEMLVTTLSRTVYGREARLDRLDPGAPDFIAAFQAAHPITRYEDVVDYWLRAKDGEPDVIWPGQTRYWPMSSGTSSAAGSNKYIPLTKRTLRTNKAGGFATFAPYFEASRDPDMIDGMLGDAKLLFLGGSTSLEEIPNRFSSIGPPNYTGDNTGIMAQFIPPWIRRFYAPGGDIAWMADWEEKVEAIADRVRGQDIRMVSGVPSWMAILFDRVRQKEGGRPIGEIWPNLRLFIHGGMNFAPYHDLFAKHIGRDILYIDSYTATEAGAVSVQDRPGTPGREGYDPSQLVISDLEAFYEFVPVEEADAKHPTAHTLDQIETGREYAIVMTTNQGLVRYVIGDTVRFTSTSPARLLITGRLSAFCNFFGEHVIQSELDSAVAAASKAAGVTVKDFTVAPEYPTEAQPIPALRWYVEFADGPPEDLAAFAAAVDRDIREASNNEDYAAHRNADQGLRAPIIEPLPPGTFFAWMKARGKLGGQNKVPRVLTKPDLEASLRETIGAGAAG